MTSRSLRLTLGALALGLALAGCGSNDPGSVAAPASEAVQAHNDADVAFVSDMTPHHEGAVAMSELAADRAASPVVQDLARRISAAQEPELTRMQELATTWGVEIGATGGHGSGHGSAHGGDEDVAALEPLSGPAFDREFLTRMIAHHESALPMATAELEDGESAPAKELASDILEVQRAEIAEMRTLLTTV